MAGSAPHVFRTPEDATTWFDAEWDDVAAAIGYAAERGPYRYAWQLVDALQDLFHHRRPVSDWLRLAALAHKAAERSGDRKGEAEMYLSLGHARWRSGDFRGALDSYERAEMLARHIGWLPGEARGAQGKGVTLKLLGTPRDALPSYRRALSLYRSLGMSDSEKVMLTNTASLCLALGQLSEAEDSVTQALALHDDAQGHNYAMALVNLALVRQKQARFQESLAELQRGLDVSRTASSLYAEAVALETLGRVFDDMGQDTRAAFAYEDALYIARRVGNRNCEVDSLVGLSSVQVRMGLMYEVNGHLDDARTIAEETGHITGMVEILLMHGTVSCAVGAYGDALGHLESAAGLAMSGNPLTLPRIRVLTGVAQWKAGDAAAALRSAHRAADEARASGQRLVLARALTVLAAVSETMGDDRFTGFRKEAEALFTTIGTPASHRTAAIWHGPLEAAGHEVSWHNARPPLPDDAEARFARYLADHFDGLVPATVTSQGVAGPAGRSS